MRTKLLTAILAAAALCMSTGAWARIKIPTLPGHVGGPGTTTPKFVEDYNQEQKLKSDALKRLDSDSTALYSDQLSLMSRVRNIQDFLDTTAARLGMLSTLDADLKKLEKAVNAVYAAAQSAEAIPQAREKAKKVKETLAPTKANVTAARERMDKIVARTEPLRRKLETAAEKAGQLNEGLWALNQGVVQQIPSVTGVANRCLLRADAAKKPCISNSLDTKANDIDKVVLEYDRVVRLLLTNPGPWLPSVDFFSPFGAELTAIDAMRDELERLTRRLEGLASQLEKLNAVLDRSFSFSFPYPNPTLTNPLRTSDYEVSVSFNTIIKGVDAIETEIEHILSSFLWSILKELGLKQYVDKLIHEANKAVNYAMDLVPFDTDINLPSLDALTPFENALAELEADVNAIKIPQVGEQLPGFGLPNVASGINFGSISGSFRFFNPSGLYWSEPDLCIGATYGCK